MTKQLKYYYRKFYQKWHYETHKALVLQGKALSQINSQKKEIKNLDEIEFQVFSQRGEDGIIQYILSKIDVPNKIFIEFGVEDYTESNTRFLLINNNWQGLVIDGCARNIKFIKSDYIYWKYDLVAKEAFITKDNINQLIGDYTTIEDVGLLSVDIDGNDYWVLEAISQIKPRVLICEYNSAFGLLPLTTPYQSDFVRSKAHYSELYFGASLGAFCHLAEKKGYDFIGSSSCGVNAYFIRKDLSAPFQVVSLEKGFNETHNRDSKDSRGHLSYLRHYDRLNVIKKLPLENVLTGESKLIADWFNL